MNKHYISLFLLLLFVSFPCFSKVFMKRDEALSTAFPGADNIEKTEIFLTEEQVREIESLSQSELDTRLYIVYVGKSGEDVLGYAIIDTHTLRTKTETVMFVVNTDGTLRKAEILAFFEPPEYMPGDNWIALFSGKGALDSLKLGKDIPNITGATITSNSLTQAIRQILAVVKIALINDNAPKEEQ